MPTALKLDLRNGGCLCTGLLISGTDSTAQYRLYTNTRGCMECLCRNKKKKSGVRGKYGRMPTYSIRKIIH